MDRPPAPPPAAPPPPAPPPAAPPLDVAALRAALGPRWGQVDVVAATGSTNADLLAQREAPDRSVLIAELQSAGRGRLDRTWTSAPGVGLTFSVLVRPEAPIATWGWLPLLTGVALHSAVNSFAGIDSVLKWPNDLLAGPERRKVAGVLAQTSGEAVVVGIGLNVSATADDLPPQGTSLALSGASDVDRTALLVTILTALDVRLAQWADVDGDAEACGLAAAYRAACATIGQPVSVSTTSEGGGQTITGTATAIDSHGRLVVATGTGEVVVGAGDVHHLRSAS